jgi:hypothetical protein
MIGKLKIEFKGFIIDRSRKNSERVHPIFLKNFGCTHAWLVHFHIMAFIMRKCAMNKKNYKLTQRSCQKNGGPNLLHEKG